MLFFKFCVFFRINLKDTITEFKNQHSHVLMESLLVWKSITYELNLTISVPVINNSGASLLATMSKGKDFLSKVYLILCKCLMHLRWFGCRLNEFIELQGWYHNVDNITHYSSNANIIWKHEWMILLMALYSIRCQNSVN